MSKRMKVEMLHQVMSNHATYGACVGILGEIAHDDISFLEHKLKDGDKVYIHTHDDSVELDMHDGDSFKAIRCEESLVQNHGGHTIYRNLAGGVWLPDDINLELLIKSSSGEISGNVRHSGIIESISANISLDVYGPLNLEAYTMGSVTFDGIKYKRHNGLYISQKINGAPKLKISSQTGDISINYIG